MTTEPICNGWCDPGNSLYEATCPLHGARAMLDSLEASGDLDDCRWNVLSVCPHGHADCCGHHDQEDMPIHQP